MVVKKNLVTDHVKVDFKFKDKNSAYDIEAIKLYEKNLLKQIKFRNKCQVGN